MYGNNNPFGGGGGQRNPNPNSNSSFQLQRNAQMTNEQREQQQQQQQQHAFQSPFRVPSTFGSGPGPGPERQTQQQEVFGVNFGTSSFSFGSPNSFNSNTNRFQRPEMGFGSSPRITGSFGTPPNQPPPLLPRFSFNTTSRSSSSDNRPMFLSPPPPPPLFPGGAMALPPPAPPPPPNYHSHSQRSNNSNSTNPPSYETALFSQNKDPKVYEKRFGSNVPSGGNVFGTIPRTLTATDNRSRFVYVANRDAERQQMKEETKLSPSRDLRTVSSSKETDRKLETKDRSESPKKPVIRRTVESGNIFARAVAGVSSPRTSSKEVKPKSEIVPRQRRTSERRGSTRESRASNRERKGSTTERRTSTSERRGSTSDSFRLSPEEMERLTSIVVKEVPSNINNKQFLMQHFGKYGIVRRINCLPKKEMATIYFSDHAGAKNAKTNGALLQSGKPEALIFWGRMVAGNTRHGTKSQDFGTRKESYVATRDVSPKSPPRRDMKELDDDVEAELQSMGQSDIVNAPRILERPKNVEVPSLVVKPVKSRLLQVSAQIAEAGNDLTAGLLHKQSFTSAEKFQTLVARDKSLRQKSKKPSDLANAKALVGTCPDMCPEKERYMREERGQLHPYEVVTGNEKTGENPMVNHRRAVKEYSRSSADQEEPLPHELRPPHVLARTMDYIICNILDVLETSKGGGSAAEWYDFVWNRTRAIRKDITQQHLCDLTSVMLVEKCARFHIHCAERLCEEDMSAFDQKINNENLTKCLQTLKHFYADLEAKGVCCPNEAEFRAYDILLNLNEGDTLREAQCFRHEIRQSEAVKFALTVFSAINSNNYVAFFKQVRRATYLCACVLQRYFTQVRTRAIKVILKAYCPPNHSGQFPMAKFTEMLAFEDVNETREFLDYHGISVEFSQIFNSTIILDKTGFAYPANPVPVRRAHNLIESKRICSVGEVVNGGSLPPNPVDIYDAHDSFDSQGFLVKDVTADDRIDSSSSLPKQRQPITEPSSAITSEVKERDVGNEQQQDRILEFQLDKAIEDTAMDLLSEVVKNEVRNVGQFITSAVQLFKGIAMELGAVLLINVTSEMIRDVAVSSLNESKLEVLRLRKQKEEAEQERRIHAKYVADVHTESRTESIVDEVVGESIEEMVRAIFSSELANERHLRMQRCSDSVSNRYLVDWTWEFVAVVCEQVYNEERERRMIILGRLSQKLSERRAYVFFRKWQNIVAKRRRMKHTREAFPSTNLGGHSKSFTEPWVGSRTSGLISPIQIANNQRQINSLLNVSAHCSLLQDSIKEKPLDVLQIARKSLTNGNKHWKVAVSMVADVQNDVLNRFVKAKLKDDVDNQLSQCSLPGVETWNMKTCNNSTVVCVKAFYGFFDTLMQMESLTRNSELIGTNGIIMLLQHPPPFQATRSSIEVHWNEEYKRLANLLHSKPSQPSIPLLILCPWQTKSGEVEAGLRLSGLTYHKLISVFNIVEIDRNAVEPSSTIRLNGGMYWLARSCPQPPDLIVEDLGTFVDKCITKQFSPAAYRMIRRSGSSSLQLHPPLHALIGEYNHVLEQAARIVSSPELKDVSWPPTEFPNVCDWRFLDSDWNSKERLSKVASSVLSHRLPLFREQVTNCKSDKQIKRLVWEYIDSLVYHAPKDTSYGSKILLVSKTQKLLDRTLNNLQCYDNVSDLIPWSDLIHIFIHYMLQVNDTTITVAYNPKLVQRFTTSKQWETFICDMSDKDDCRSQFDASAILSPTLKTRQETSDRREKLLKRKVTEDPFAQLPREKELKREYRELNRQLSIEKQRNAEYNDYLEKLVLGGNL